MKHAWNDFGNTERVIAKFGDRIKWVRDEKKGTFIIYDDRKWEAWGADTTVRGFVWETLKYMDEDEAGEYDDTPTVTQSGKPVPSERDRFLAWSKSQKSAGAVDSCMRILNAHPDLLAWPGEFNKERFLLNFENGTMDTNSMEFAEHDSADMQTRMLPFPYMPGEQCPTWIRFLEQSIPDAATREYLQKLVDYTLTGRSNEKILPWLVGPANTGKSIVVNALAKLFGQDYGVTANDNALRPKRGNGASPEVNSMKGKRYVTTSETGHGATLDEALIKRLTGGDVQNSRGLYQNESNWNPECVIWVASNAFPQPHGDDDAIWGRFRPIEFTVVYGPDNPERDPRLGEKLAAELEGIASWRPATRSGVSWPRPRRRANFAWHLKRAATAANCTRCFKSGTRAPEGLGSARRGSMSD